MPITSLPLSLVKTLVQLIPHTTHTDIRTKTQFNIVETTIFNAWIIKIPNTTFRLSRGLSLTPPAFLHPFEKLQDEWVSKCAFGFMFPTRYSIHCINWDWWFHIYMFIKDSVVVAVNAALLLCLSRTKTSFVPVIPAQSTVAKRIYIGCRFSLSKHGETLVNHFKSLQLNFVAVYSIETFCVGHSATDNSSVCP